MKTKSIELMNPEYINVRKCVGNKPPRDFEELYNTCSFGDMFFPYYKNTRGEVSMQWNTNKSNNRIVKIKVRK